MTFSADCLQIVVGSIYRLRETDDTQIRLAKTVIVHELYDNMALKNDIGIILLKNELDETEFIESVVLPMKRPKSGMQCITLGWGRIYGVSGANKLIFAAKF